MDSETGHRTIAEIADCSHCGFRCLSQYCNCGPKNTSIEDFLVCPACRSKYAGCQDTVMHINRVPVDLSVFV